MPMLFSFSHCIQRERVYVWKQAKSLPFYAFLVLRYFPLILLTIAFDVPNSTIEILSPGPLDTPFPPSLYIFSSANCKLPSIRLALAPVITVTARVILTLRVNAIYSQEKWVKWLVGVVYMGQIGATIFLISFGGLLKSAISDSCKPIYELDINPNSLLAILLSSIIFDLLIFYLTSRKGLEARAKGTGSSLLKVLVRGGNLYFMSLFLVNFINVILTTLTRKTFENGLGVDSFPWIGDYIGNITLQLTSIITTVITSHLFLDLREAAYRSRESSDNPLTVRATVGKWFNFNQSESELSDLSTQPGCGTRDNRFIGQRTLQGMMGHEDFSVDLHHFDDGDYNLTSEDNEDLLKEDFENGRIAAVTASLRTVDEAAVNDVDLETLTFNYYNAGTTLNGPSTRRPELHFSDPRASNFLVTLCIRKSSVSFNQQYNSILAFIEYH
ncbi:hypothetical protein M422DRAFT_264117 [Sphaerobolus stellatus SS14]|uniref:Uncharacterized protein n=1 Tax=Sphaerobolus stellatus (strain SS14) TaxID=990650 RepID=A0A0C9UX15_SPHS4|nr:hypothetical protein M422DRAFT_264117 [Sphaerobolus stellatus SS14]